MLARQIEKYISKQITGEMLKERIGALIASVVDSNEKNTFPDYFAGLSYHSPIELKEGQDKVLSINTLFLQLAVHYACLQGNKKLVSYLIETFNIPGDLEVDVSDYHAYFSDKKVIKGPLLTVAAASGNGALVVYLYEKTAAMIETSAAQPLEETALMVAVKGQHLPVVQYLLQHGANANADIYAGLGNVTPLRIAIDVHNLPIAEMLINAGAIVTNADVSYALKHGADTLMVKRLLADCINEEDPYEPFILSAIEGGHVDVFQEFDSVPERRLERYAKFNQTPITKRMAMAAAKSGEVAMMRYLIEEKQLPLAELISEENDEQVAYLRKNLTKPGFDHSMERIHACFDTIICCAATKWTTDKNKAPLLKYLFEDLNLRPSTIVIKELCARNISELRASAYVLSLLLDSEPNYASQKYARQLRSIALNLDEFTLEELFEAYNCPLVREGNKLDKYSRDHLETIAKRIKEKEEVHRTKEVFENGGEIYDLVKDNKNASIGALFYYCNREFDKDPGPFIGLFTQLIECSQMFSTADIQNCLGETLAHYAFQCKNMQILKYLLARGANPDLPDNDGETLIYRILFLSMPNNLQLFESIKADTVSVANSLLYASKHGLGPDALILLLKFTKGETHDVPVAKLVDNALADYGSERKLSALFCHLTVAHAQAMVNYLKEKGHYRHLSDLECVSESIMSSEEKDRRLGKVIKQVVVKEQNITLQLSKQSFFNNMTVEFSDKEMADSEFGKGSNTAKFLKKQ